jgi:hypothetical protein
MTASKRCTPRWRGRFALRSRSKCGSWSARAGSGEALANTRGGLRGFGDADCGGRRWRTGYRDRAHLRDRDDPAAGARAGACLRERGCRRQTDRAGHRAWRRGRGRAARRSGESSASLTRVESRVALPVQGVAAGPPGCQTRSVRPRFRDLQDNERIDCDVAIHPSDHRVAVDLRDHEPLRAVPPDGQEKHRVSPPSMPVAPRTPSRSAAGRSRSSIRSAVSRTRQILGRRRQGINVDTVVGESQREPDGTVAELAATTRARPRGTPVSSALFDRFLTVARSRPSDVRLVHTTAGPTGIRCGGVTAGRQTVVTRRTTIVKSGRAQGPV